MLLNTEEILLEKEIQGIKFSLYGKIIILTLVTIGTFFVAHTLRDLLTVVGISIALNIILYILSKLLQKRKYIQFVGLFCVGLDLLIITILPFIWYNSAGGDATVPRTYLIKTYIHFLIAGTLIMNAFSLQPIYPLFYALGVVISQAGLLVYAQQDPRFLTTENFREAVLGEAVHLNNYILSMGIIGTLGFFLAYLTFRVRRTVLLAVKNELKIQKLNSHFSPETMSEIRKQTEDILPIGGKEIKVAVMYCDIVGFTPLSESIGVAKTMELLTAYHGFVLERIFEFKGTLDHFRGDGMYISFGTPFSTGFDAENALLSGLSIFDKLKDFNSEREKEGEKSIQLRIVIHFGSVLFGNTGQQENAEFTVIGEAVTIVNRLEGYAKESKKSFLVSKDLIAEIPNFNSLGIKTVAMSSLPAKGKQRSIDVISIEKKL